MTRLYIALGGIALLVLAGLYVKTLIQEMEVMRIASEQDRIAIERLQNDIRIKEEINNEHVQRIRKIQQELTSTQQQLAALPRTDTQRACDAEPLPAGYVDGLLRAYSAAGTASPVAR